jgi:two-component system CheB/CheR fusion protein
MTNLLNNAAKFTEPGGHIWLTAEAEGGKGGRTLVIRVRDNGIGIAPELLPNIFDLFIQGDHSLERTRGGLGIGLTLVRSLVQMHDGTIEAKSAGVGQGSEFIIRLPAAAPPTALPKPEPIKEKATPKRILVVDDNHDQAHTLGMLLKLMGHEVRLAHDGPSGLAEAREFAPEVALVDIGLPGMSGYEVARHIRQDEKLRHILLMAQTGWGQEEDRQRSREAGFDHHIVKPIDMQSLQEIIRQGRPAPA